MTREQMQTTLARMAHEIAERTPPDAPLAIVGIRRRGDSLARRLRPLVEGAGRKVAHFGAVDITLYRDDLSTIGPQAKVRGTELEFDVTGTWLVLVDDVLYTGRSVRAALDAIMDIGRPRAIKLAVLVDRGWRELPIHGDFIGRKIETSAEQIVKVKVDDIDGKDEVEIVVKE